MSLARAATTVLAAIAAVVLAVAAAGSPSAAQGYPNRPITIIVPFAAGGPTDVLARVLGERMRATLGQPVLIENVTGAGGSIGVGRVVSSPPDGYTISIGHFGTHVANGAIYPLKYDLLKDLDPVARLPSNPMVFVTRKNFPADAALKINVTHQQKGLRAGSFELCPAYTPGVDPDIIPDWAPSIGTDSHARLLFE